MPCYNAEEYTYGYEVYIFGETADGKLMKGKTYFYGLE
jgi:hypothetical protein